MPQVKKNRFIAAAYSFLVWGLGELYAGFTNLKIGIGIALMVFWFVYLFIVGITVPPIYISLPIYLFFSIFSAIDAYNDAKRYNIKIEIEEANRRRTPDKCPNCGEKLSGKPRFCPNCGYKLVE